MQPLYRKMKEHYEIFLAKTKHDPPHLHKSVEFAYVIEGTLEIGIGKELYHMDTGDFAIVFPELVHHYQAFDPKPGKVIFLMLDPTYAGNFLSVLQQHCPENPVIPRDQLHPDIAYAMKSLLAQRKKLDDAMIPQAFSQIILAHALPRYTLVEKNSMGPGDIIEQTMAYISGHFTEEITLTSMAKDLGFSPYALSRVFSSTFHRNFNQYLNEIRLNYASSLLLYTNQTITEAYINSGFNSQRTFNRAFQERFHMTPREYRKEYQQQHLENDERE